MTTAPEPPATENSADLVQPSVPRITGLYTAAIILDRAAAFLVVAMLAWLFGAGQSSDAYYIAYWLPIALLTVVGEVSFAFIVPEIRSLQEAGQPGEALDRSGRYLTAGVWISIVVTLLYLGLAPIVTGVLGKSFDETTRRLALSLGWLYGSYVGLMIYTSISGSVLAAWGRHSRNAFVLPCSTIAIAGSTALLYALGAGIRSFPLGAASGQALALLVILFPGLRRLRMAGMRLRWNFSTRGRSVRPLGTFLLLTFPVILPVLLVGVERRLAGLAGPGSAAILGFARPLLVLPGLIAAPVGNALMSRLTTRTGRESHRITWVSLGWTIFYGVTVSFLLAVSIELVLGALYGHGAYSADDLERTRTALLYMLTGLAGMVVYPILIRVFQAKRRLLALVASSLSGATYFLLAPGLGARFGTDGLALAFGAATSLPGLFALGFLAVEATPPRGLLRGWLIQVTLAGTLTSIHLGLIHGRVAGSSPVSIAVAGAEVILYFGILFVVGNREVRLLWDWARGRPSRRDIGDLVPLLNAEATDIPAAPRQNRIKRDAPPKP